MGGKCNRRDCDGNCDFNRRALVSFLPSFLPPSLAKGESVALLASPAFNKANAPTTKFGRHSPKGETAFSCVARWRTQRRPDVLDRFA